MLVASIKGLTCKELASFSSFSNQLFHLFLLVCDFNNFKTKLIDHVIDPSRWSNAWSVKVGRSCQYIACISALKKTLNKLYRKSFPHKNNHLPFIFKF